MFSQIFDLLATFTLVTVCLNLSHQNSLRSGPYGKIIATGYGMIAIALLAEAFFHWAGRDWIAFTAFIKMLFSVTLGFASARTEKIFIHQLEEKRNLHGN